MTAVDMLGDQTLAGELEVTVVLPCFNEQDNVKGFTGDVFAAMASALTVPSRTWANVPSTGSHS